MDGVCSMSCWDQGPYLGCECNVLELYQLLPPGDETQELGLTSNICYEAYAYIKLSQKETNCCGLTSGRGCDQGQGQDQDLAPAPARCSESFIFLFPDGFPLCRPG